MSQEQVYVTQTGDVLDLVCHHYYGNTSMTEQVLEANNFLCDYPVHLPRGLSIRMPDQPNAGVKEVDVIRLWG